MLIVDTFTRYFNRTWIVGDPFIWKQWWYHTFLITKIKQCFQTMSLLIYLSGKHLSLPRQTVYTNILRPRQLLQIRKKGVIHTYTFFECFYTSVVSSKAVYIRYYLLTVQDKVIIMFIQNYIVTVTNR